MISRVSYLCITFYLLIFFHVGACKNNKDPKDEILPPCQACKAIVNSFLKGMEKTNKKHFGGGDTAWEEEKLGNYTNSEVRLVEIQEHLCSDVERGQHQCYSLSEEWEQDLEHWWFTAQKEDKDLMKWLCITKFLRCCPENHFGPECKPCNGYPDKICNNNGKCKGAGTRKGNGECSCNAGYNGSTCHLCADGYYEAYKDERKLLCSKCHVSCEHSCNSAGPKGCHYCKSGWTKDEKLGCRDINECLETDACARNMFCVNNDGSFSCIACDEACDGCHGDGPDMCTKCAQNYNVKDGYCQVSQKTDNFEWARYCTYLGLCLATCIIFQKNSLIASIVGLAVAVYVATSEYLLSTTFKHDDLQDAAQFIKTE